MIIGIISVDRHKPSIELALTNCAQSTSNASGILSHVIDWGMRKYTWAEDNLSTWNQTSWGHAYLISSSSGKISKIRRVEVHKCVIYELSTLSLPMYNIADGLTADAEHEEFVSRKCEVWRTS